MAQLQAKASNNQPPKATPPGPNGLKKVAVGAKDAPPKPADAAKKPAEPAAAKPDAAKKPEPGKPTGLIVAFVSTYLFLNHCLR